MTKAPLCPECQQPLTQGVVGITVAQRHYEQVVWDEDRGGYVIEFLGKGDGDDTVINDEGHSTVLLDCEHCGHDQIDLVEGPESDEYWALLTVKS